MASNTGSFIREPEKSQLQVNQRVFNNSTMREGQREWKPQITQVMFSSVSTETHPLQAERCSPSCLWPQNEKGRLLHNNSQAQSSIDARLLAPYIYNFPFSLSLSYRSEVFLVRMKVKPPGTHVKSPFRSRCMRKHCWVWMGSGVRSSTLSINHSKLLWQVFTAMSEGEVWAAWNMSFKCRDWGRLTRWVQQNIYV